jgi:hypothetical protein
MNARSSLFYSHLVSDTDDSLMQRKVQNPVARRK